jgi:hypothetical protein
MVGHTQLPQAVEFGRTNSQTDLQAIATHSSKPEVIFFAIVFVAIF